MQVAMNGPGFSIKMTTAAANVKYVIYDIIALLYIHCFVVGVFVVR